VEKLETSFQFVLSAARFRSFAWTGKKNCVVLRKFMPENACCKSKHVNDIESQSLKGDRLIMSQAVKTRSLQCRRREDNCAYSVPKSGGK
jgi:hypothetical protein